MTKRTTLNRLTSYLAKKEAEVRGDSWYVNSNEHPLPKLPSVEYLAGPYISELAKGGATAEQIETAAKTIALISQGKPETS